MHDESEATAQGEVPGERAAAGRLREELGDFNSVVCLKAIMTGMEDILGVRATAVSLTSAGRIRGKAVFDEMRVSKGEPLEVVTARLNAVLGRDGTRLCVVDRIERDGEVLLVSTRETVCSAGEEAGSDRKCTYTLGVIWGALEQVLGKRFRGVQVESVLRGGSHDVFRFEER